MTRTFRNELERFTDTFSSTRSYTTICEGNLFGDPYTATVTYVSFISQSDADTRALALAQLEAESLIVCSVISWGSEIITFENAFTFEGLVSSDLIDFTDSLEDARIKLNDFFLLFT